MKIHQRNRNSLGIYIHFPWCIQKCAYCDFYSIGLRDLGNTADQTMVPEPELLSKYFIAIKKEFQIRLNQFEDLEVDSIYFGGGTASLMTVKMIEDILKLFYSDLKIASNVEITLEGNPENMTITYLNALSGLGVNRVNTGLQTSQSNYLDQMHRYYDPEHYWQVLQRLENCNIVHVGVDLIYGFPNQTYEEFYKDLKSVTSYEIDHLSVYSLTAEAGTPYGNAVHTNLQNMPDEELQADIFAGLPALLQSDGFQQYEISNYARPTGQCRHNLRYWLYEPSMALGPGAHGFTGSRRYQNSRNLERWLVDPGKSGLKRIDPLLEFPIGYLRLSSGLLPDEYFNTLIECGVENILFEEIKQIFDEWVYAGYMRLVKAADPGRGYAWTMTGQLHLDERILEISSLNQ